MKVILVQRSVTLVRTSQRLMLKLVKLRLHCLDNNQTMMKLELITLMDRYLVARIVQGGKQHCSEKK
jgi:hypothetical protein